MVSMLEWVLEIMRTTQIKGHIIGICCYSTKHASLRCKSKGLLVQNLDNGPESWLLVNHCFNEPVCFNNGLVNSGYPPKLSGEDNLGGLIILHIYLLPTPWLVYSLFPLDRAISRVITGYPTVVDNFEYIPE